VQTKMGMPKKISGNLSHSLNNAYNNALSCK
jgi:hypothetical protein